jgi:2-haloacid dehalogenase
MTSLGAASMFAVSRVPIRGDVKIKAIAFDAFVIFDPGSIFKPLKELLPNQAQELIELWQLKQFSYQWLRVSANKYKNFLEVAKDALDFTLAQHRLPLNDHEKDLIISGYESMHAWPDVLPALQAIKNSGLKTCFLSNMTTKMLEKGIQNSDLANFFDLVISTDEKQIYKPNRAAYRMVVEKLKLQKEEILFVPFAGWDMAGSKWFGFPTFWINRQNALAEKLDEEPDATGTSLNDLVAFIREGH